jgi:hypothetical protein
MFFEKVFDVENIDKDRYVLHYGKDESVKEFYNEEFEFNLWKIEDINENIELYNVFEEGKNKLKKGKWYVFSEYENYSENEEKHIYNDQVVSLCQVKDNRLHVYFQASEGGYFIVNNYKDFKEFLRFMDYYDESDIENEELRKRIKSKKIDKPFIVEWGM